MSKTGKKRLCVGSIRNPIYRKLKLSNGSKLSHLESTQIDIPLSSQRVGYLHINSKQSGMFEKYQDHIDEIINHPDYIFEDKFREDTILVAKQIIANHVMLVIALNFAKPRHTNTLVTLWEVAIGDFERERKRFEKFGKVLYIKGKVSV